MGMNIRQRQLLVRDKLLYYVEEIRGLKNGSTWYKIGFGLLLLVLFPILILELLLVLLVGRDTRLVGRPEAIEPPILVEDEVPKHLRDLIPLARKFGVGDDADRGDIMKAASNSELEELEEAVSTRQQEIAEWLNTFPENGISDTASFFLYLGSACDEVCLYKSHKQT
jgi:hypothetical protein